MVFSLEKPQMAALVLWEYCDHHLIKHVFRNLNVRSIHVSALFMKWIISFIDYIFFFNNLLP